MTFYGRRKSIESAAIQNSYSLYFPEQPIRYVTTFNCFKKLITQWYGHLASCNYN